MASVLTEVPNLREGLERLASLLSS
jgi:hypothetical protein